MNGYFNKDGQKSVSHWRSLFAAYATGIKMVTTEMPCMYFLIIQPTSITVPYSSH